MKTRHKRVQIRMRTWLNMAECVLWIARCRSFCNTHILPVFHTAVNRNWCGFIWQWLTLTIMLSRAHLASQQLRNTGINRFLSGGQKIWHTERGQITLSAVVGRWDIVLKMHLTVMMKGRVFSISNRKDTWNICSHMLPWKNTCNDLFWTSGSNSCVFILLCQSKMQELDIQVCDSENWYQINQHSVNTFALRIYAQAHLVAEVR